MSDEPTAGQRPRTRTETRPRQKYTPCEYGDSSVAADGPRRGGPSGADRARLCADGGTPSATSSPRDPAEWFADDRPVILECNAFRRDLFVTTALYGAGGAGGSRPNGLDLRRALERLRGRTVYNSQLYRAFHDLIDAGLLRTDPRQQDANHYFVTERGTAALCAYARLVQAAARATSEPGHELPAGLRQEADADYRSEPAGRHPSGDDRGTTGGDHQ